MPAVVSLDKFWNAIYLDNYKVMEAKSKAMREELWNNLPTTRTGDWTQFVNGGAINENMAYTVDNSLQTKLDELRAYIGSNPQTTHTVADDPYSPFDSNGKLKRTNIPDFLNVSTSGSNISIGLKWHRETFISGWFKKYYDTRTAINELSKYGFDQSIISTLRGDLNKMFKSQPCEKLYDQLKYQQGYTSDEIEKIVDYLADVFEDLIKQNPNASFKELRKSMNWYMWLYGIQETTMDLEWFDISMAMEQKFRDSLANNQVTLTEEHIMSPESNELRSQRKDYQLISLNVLSDMTLTEFADEYERVRSYLSELHSKGIFSDTQTDLYLHELDSTFSKTSNHQIVSQALDAGLSIEKAEQLSRQFNEEYIRLRNEAEADSIVNTNDLVASALKSVNSSAGFEFIFFSTNI